MQRGGEDDKLIHIYVKKTGKIKRNLNYVNLQTPKYVKGLFFKELGTEESTSDDV